MRKWQTDANFGPVQCKKTFKNDGEMIWNGPMPRFRDEILQRKSTRAPRPPVPSHAISAAQKTEGSFAGEAGRDEAGWMHFSWAGPQTSRSEIWAFTQLRHTTTIHYTSFSIHKQGMELSSSRSSCGPQFSTTDPIQKLSYLREIHRHVSSTTLKSLKNTYVCENIQCIYIYTYLFTGKYILVRIYKYIHAYVFMFMFIRLNIAISSAYTSELYI